MLSEKHPAVVGELHRRQGAQAKAEARKAKAESKDKEKDNDQQHDDGIERDTVGKWKGQHMELAEKRCLVLESMLRRYSAVELEFTMSQ